MIHNSQNPLPTSSPSLLDLIEQVTDRLQGGEAVEVESWLDQHPQHADRLRKILPALQIMENLSRSAEDLSLATSLISERRLAEPAMLPGTLGDFHILREIARGGMGVVYEAEQISLNRRVALKVLPLAGMLDERQIQRFRNEAQAAALLHHEHIVPIHAVGCVCGVHYYAMQYIEGRTLADVIHDLRAPRTSLAGAPNAAIDDSLTGPQSTVAAAGVDTEPLALQSTDPASKNSRFREIVRIGIQVAEALEHAHGLGVVHRDIKPSNLLLDGRGKIWVTDFGLAQIESGANLTLTGDILGTLRYMSPEQAGGDRRLVDHRTDIYCLGITLYELLAARPAFAEIDRPKLLRQVLEDDPQPLRQIDPAIPRDLETIVLKATQKTPEGRYASAQPLADDLRAFLAHQPIRAKRPTLIDHIGKWSRRHRMSLVATIIVLMLAVVGLLIGTALIFKERNAARAAATAALAARAKAEAAAEESRRHAHFSQQLAYAANVGSAAQAWKTGDIRSMTDLLDQYAVAEGEPDLRGFAWWHLWRQADSKRQTLCKGADGACFVRHSPSGDYLAVAWQDGMLDLWDAKARHHLAAFRGDKDMLSAIDFSPQEDRLASVGYEGVVRLWDIPRRREIRRFRVAEGHGNRVFFALDGEVLLTSGDEGCVRLWDSETGTPLGQFDGFSQRTHFGVRHRLACSPDGRLCVAGDGEGRSRVFDIQSREVIRAFNDVPAAGVAKFFKFSPDGQLIAAGMNNHKVQLWNAATGKRLAAFTGHDDDIQDAAFHPSSSLLATSDRAGVIRVWDLSALLAPPDLKFEAGIQWSVFLPDGRICVWTGDNQLLIHDRSTDTTLPVPLMDRTPLATLNRKVICASPDGRRLLCRSELYDISPERPEAWQRLVVFNQDVYNVDSAAFSADGRMVATADQEGRIRLWDAASARLLAVLDYPWNHRWRPVYSVAFSADGKWLAAAGKQDSIVVWDVARREVSRTFQGHRPTAWLIQFSPDSHWLAAASADRHVRLWNVETGEQSEPLGHPSTYFASLAFSPGGQAMATLTSNFENRIRLWDLRDQRLLATYDLPDEGVALDASFSPDGRFLAAGRGQTLRFYPWRDALLSQCWPPSWRAHEDRTWSLEFSPDGRRLVSASRDGEVALWPTRLRSPHVLDRAPRAVAAAFTPTGGELITAGPGGLRIWSRGIDTLSHLANCPETVKTMAVSPDSATLVTGHSDGAVQFWDLSTGNRGKTLRGHEERIVRTIFSPAGDFLLSASVDGAVYLWDALSGARRAVLARSGGNAAAFSPDGRLLATGAQENDDVLVFSNGDFSRPIHRLAGHQNAVNALTFSPDGRLLASTSSDRTVRVWEAATGKVLHVIRAHSDSVATVAFSPDGQILASGDKRGVVAFSHAETGRFLFDVQIAHWIRELQFSTDGAVLAATTSHGAKILEGRPDPEEFNSQQDHAGQTPLPFLLADEPVAARRVILSPPDDEPFGPTRPADHDAAPPDNPRSDITALAYAAAAQKRLANQADWKTYQSWLEHRRSQTDILNGILHCASEVESLLAGEQLDRPQIDLIYDHLKNCELALRTQWLTCRVGHHLPAAQEQTPEALEAATHQQISQIIDLVNQQLEPTPTPVGVR